jgi:short-subunit dehydrogenase
MVALNVGATTRLLAHFVPPMVARGRGRVLNVASVAAFQALPSLATYAASKAFVLSLTESLAEELRGSGVTVTALCPGITATGMLGGARHEVTALEKLPAFLVGDADVVAAEGVDACLAGEVIRVPGLLNQAAILASRATPRELLRRLGGALARRIR